MMTSFPMCLVGWPRGMNNSFLEVRFIFQPRLRFSLGETIKAQAVCVTERRRLRIEFGTISCHNRHWGDKC